MRVLTFTEQQQYLAAAPPALHDIAMLMLEPPCVPTRSTESKRDSVHLEGGYVFNPVGKTKAARRKIPLTKTGFPSIRSASKGRPRGLPVPLRR